MVKIKLTTDELLNALITMITRNIKIEKATCTVWRFFTASFAFKFSALAMPKKSTQNDVVKAVSAESVVANVAAVKPSINIIAGTAPRLFKAISGNNKSVLGFPVM